MRSPKRTASTFTDIYRSVSYFNASGPVPLARLRGSESYQSFMWDTLPGASQKQAPQAIKQMLKKTLSDIRDEARAIKGDLTRIGVISYPAHFDNSAIDALFYAAEASAAAKSRNFGTVKNLDCGFLVLKLVKDC